MVYGTPILNATTIWTAQSSYLIDGTELRPGMKMLGLCEPGFRSNGFTFLREILYKKYGTMWYAPQNVLNLIMTPSTIYKCAVLGALDHCHIDGMIHITGGGIAGRMEKYLKRSGVGAIIDLPEPNALVKELLEEGLVTHKEACSHWNMGVGFVIISQWVDDIQQYLENVHGIESFVLGEIIEGGIEIKAWKA